MTHTAHRLAAVWFADVVGYSELAGRDEAAAIALVESLQAVARESVSVHGGRIVKFIGDAVMAEFPSADAAVRSAIELRDGFGRVSASGFASGLRIGVHDRTGRPIRSNRRPRRSAIR